MNDLVEHSFALVLPSSNSPSSPTGLTQILALVKRSDSVPVRSEGTRVLVNVVKSLWAADPAASPAVDVVAETGSGSKVIFEKQRTRAAAIRAVLSAESALALATLVGRSGKYPLLVNEGIVALSLLCTHKEGGRSHLSLEHADYKPIPRAACSCRYYRSLGP